MTDQVKPEDKYSSMKTDDKYRSYIVQASFWRYDGGPLRVLARTEEEAKEILPKLLGSNVRDLEVHTVIPESQIEHNSNEPEQDVEPSSVPPTSTMVN